MNRSVRRIRIATYNVHKCRGLDRRTSPARIADVIEQLDADIVALQEVLDVRDGGPEWDQVRCLATKLREYHWRFGENRQLRGGAYGNATFSRLPVSFSQNYDLTWRHRERRGCLRTDFDCHGIVLHVFNVHLGTSFMERRHQGRRLLSPHVIHGEDLAGRKIVVGDFNEWTKGLTSRLMSEGFRTAEARTFRRDRRSYPGVFPIFRLDHVYYDRNISLAGIHLHRNAKALVASDHLPVVADFAL